MNHEDLIALVEVLKARLNSEELSPQRQEEVIEIMNFLLKVDRAFNK